MNAENLKLLIAEGEGLSIEFKEKYTPKIDRDLVAFANTRGGRILLGVRDDGHIVGERLTNQMKAEIQSLARNCEPSISVSKISQLGDVVIIEVPAGDDKPYGCASGYYRRLDAVTQKMSRKEIQHLFQGMSSMPFEEQIAKEVLWHDISKDKIRKFFEEARIDYGKTDPQSVLDSLNLSKGDKIKNAGVLFFAQDPRRFILQCQMTLVAFKGTNRVNIYDRKDVQDDLVTQYKEAMIFLERHLNVRSEIKGADRRDIYEIPLEALREAAANAIIHRDYTMRGTSIMVEVHEDRVVISNPGGFPQDMNEKRMGEVSIRRNELIADIFARMHKVERVGSGFKRIRESMEAAGLPFPLIESNNFFFIQFKRPFYSLKDSPGATQQVPEKVTVRVPEKVTANQALIMAEMRKSPYITVKELSNLVGISERKIKENIRKLKEKSLIKRIGPDKGGQWAVAE